MSERVKEGSGCAPVIFLGVIGLLGYGMVHFGPGLVGQAARDPHKITLPKIEVNFHMPNFGSGATGPVYTGKDPAQITVNAGLTQASAEKLFGVVLQAGGENNTWPTKAQKAGIQEIAFAIGKNTYGWDEADDECEVELWDDESGWSSQAHNPESADGIPQDLMNVNGKETLEKFPDFVSNPVEQVQWGEVYIDERYENPCKALHFWIYDSPQYDGGSHWY